MKYEPEYANGEIIVFFRYNKEGIGEDFASAFGSYLGFGLKEEWERGDYAFVYNCPDGKEEEAIEKFTKLVTFVDGSCRRDLKMERRWDEIEEAERMIEGLGEECDHLSKYMYNNRLTRISDYLNRIMEK